ncbi:MAG TPA: cardiolipin synthase [Candidatus Borkfalkia avicola]|uniref:Cardiolipin synthase n=1 Tax=Candidatus Borkfalkia avicola TaxID=2838503 RepID=A0A9D2D7E1_9FIRM|nr:cardiolipin synthase [Candidatus Borkfalkia avicola]
MRLKKLGKLLTSKFLLVCFLLLIEIAIIPAVFYWFFFSVDTTWIFAVLCAAVVILDLAIALWIVNSDMNAEYKIAWLMPVLFLPPIGALLYLNLRRRPRPRRRLKQLAEKFAGMECLYVKKDGHVGTEYADDGFAASCAEYVAQATGLPPTDCYEFEYFPSGESYCERLLEELEKAEKYIFLEYFILRPGKFWNSVLDILKRKAGEGVDVRVIYDDIGSMLKVPDNYAAELEKQGVKCMCFNPFRPVLDLAQNNRTHRKIALIDGVTAFTGGINLSDEYINETHPFGHWKDTGIMVRGRAAQNFAAMFLQLWFLRAPDEDYTRYLSTGPKGDCSCLAFCDSPLDRQNVCEDLYLKIIYHAKKYVYINTPYLILDGEMKRALITAAHSGVDVRITVPDIPDKKYVFAVTKAFYSELIKEGIHIYRYKPGFIHAKSIVSDDKYCIIGSTNMDFRSFYLHFECNMMFFDERVSAKLTADYLDTCKQCDEVKKEHFKESIFRLIYRAVLRVFAPLM